MAGEQQFSAAGGALRDHSRGVKRAHQSFASGRQEDHGSGREAVYFGYPESMIEMAKFRHFQ